MKEIFTLSGLTAKETKDGDTKISFRMETEVGPGFWSVLYGKLQPMNNQAVNANIDLVQSRIDTETGEVS